ncbi:MAG TPA: glycosyltransferase [Burkholderiales bacterium]|nr:glycosyltransferase [Burkholderiales bacterium]
MTRARGAGKRLLIVEESLVDHHGHWFSYARRVAEFNQAEGVTVEVAAHARVSRELEWSVAVHPLFAASYWDGSYPVRHKPRKQLAVLVRSNWRAYRELAAHFARHERYDLVFAPSVIAHQLLAWLALAWRFRRRIGCAVLLIRMGPSEPHGIEGDPISDWNVRFIARWLRRFRPLIARGRVRFATDSEALAREYRGLCGLEFTVLPSAQYTAPRAETGPASAHAALRFTSLGPAHFIKGIDVLLEAIRLLRADPPRRALHFVIHWPLPQAVGLGRPPLSPDEDLAASGWVEYVRRSLSADEYDELLRSSDCTVLPYRVNPYRLRTSGVLVEAATAGVPAIVTAGTTLEEGLRAWGTGLVAKDGDARDLAEQIRAFAADAEAFRARARERIAAARAHHSPARFQDLLWGRTRGA